MAWPTQRLKIAVFIGAALCFWYDVVNRGCRNRLLVSQAFLTDMAITLQDARADNIPLTAIAALVSVLSALMLLPAFVTVSLAIT